ncbi:MULTISPECIES: phosphotransferase family protein [unclassified Paenibacillus]|uniref:phosphotransferase family protein n=1 Tax=unclassified Paenibacillus TaxID=185978 RepID=UPI0009A5AA56|nr:MULTISPECIES: phosphotransferase [unclassified Paenibacillus]SLJ89256.1 Phosphotransferase enzyme family protein [Paenibacillus sp. RU5A]SOC59357.1 Phosphotransferase enzyme family protein [Paenibacillus sp. RU26A]SOC68317.1 Phosphotransferase enzyme family protein [Paenibacillus sp. RU5M]
MSSILNVIEKLKLNVLNIENVPESFSSDVYKLTLLSGEDVYVKIPYNKDKLFREFQMLEILKDVIPVPKVLDIWYGDESNTGALLLSAIQGVPCTENMDEKLSFQMGVYHAMLHEVKTPGYGYHSNDGFNILDQNNWRLHIKNNFEKWKEPCKELLEPALYERCILHFDGVFSALPDPDGPCFVHMDFRPGNILVNGNKVTGIIDFESARGGSSEIDFTKINRYIWEVNPRTKSPYFEGYQTIRNMLNLEIVLPFYNFYDAFSAVVWCKNRGVERNQSFLQESIEVLKKSVSY